MDGQTPPPAAPEAQRSPTRLAQYQPYPYRLERTELVFRLAPRATRVTARLHVAEGARTAPLWLDGEGLRLCRIEIDGVALADYTLSDTGLAIPAARLPAQDFVLETEVEIAPEANTALEGLYMSGGMYCTQCEAEGFRKITFYPDRPDVMTRFSVRIESDLPVLLSNGNPGAAGPGWAEWDDPWPKPAYLFALVAGDLVEVAGAFVTMEGRAVRLGIWVRPGDEGRCGFALEALRRSMDWDERVWGRAYDLEVFNIVAVDDFNMGAMENKGLNIFNSKWVLASPQTATDADYERIEGIIAHEYFHNWTGNRITCRDWFQLCLKEGLTVYRDQTFTQEMRAGAVKRIEDVIALRARQFREDQGPLAHPVRPDHYVEINNFYTATVYEKGAEIIGMLRRLIGEAAWARGKDLYFARHDGQACTIEDWLAVFAEVSGRDLTQFARWYTDAGTPRLSAREDWDGQTLTLTLRQETPPTPGQDAKPPRVIPVAVALLAADGTMAGPERVLEMTAQEESFRFEGLAARPVLSLLRGFSAPVMLTREGPDARALLLAHDTDPFSAWDAGRDLAREALETLAAGAEGPAPAAWIAAIGGLLARRADPGFTALCLRLPAEEEIAKSLADRGETPDPDRIFAARENLLARLARDLEGPLDTLYTEMETPGPFRPEPRDAGQRAARLAALAALSRIDGGARAEAMFRAAGNMTEEVGALAALCAIGAGEAALAAFHDRWQGERLVMDKWFMLQLQMARPEDAPERAARLAAHPLFDWKNPNRFRALMSGLAANHAGFHRADGAGYDFYADWLLRLDPLNPQTAARMSTAFETWRRHDGQRQATARAAIGRILAAPGLSRDLQEMASRLLAG